MKKDIKYIIKRIIIGVGIAFGVMLVKSLPVFADELQNYYIFYDEDFFNSSSYTFSLKTTQHANSSIVDSFIVYDEFKINLTMDNNFNYNGYYYLLYNKSTDKYIMQYFAKQDKLDFNYTYGLVYSQLSSGAPFQITFGSLKVFYNSDFKSITAPIDLNNYTNNVDYKTLNYSVLGESIYYGYTISKNSDNSLSIVRNYDSVYENDWEIVSTNIKSNIYKQLNQKVYNFYTYDTTPPIPTGYEKIDMFNNYAILFYPKDFRNLPIECTKSKDGVITDDDGNVTVIPNKICLEESYKFTFYYSGYFNTAFTDLSVMDVVKNPVEQLTFPPTATSYELPLLRNINDFKGGIMFYNNSLSQITDKDGNVTTYYDKGYIYYDSSLFNYVIIEDYDTTPNQNISWVDKDGNTQNATINNIPNKNQTTLNKAQDTFDLFKNFKTNDHGLSSIITSPLSFIKNLSSATCTPVVLPIPFSKNQNVKLPCLTTMYEEKASAVYSIYKIVITGITAYWVCVRIYALVKGFKDPNDDKIEVMEL